MLYIDTLQLLVTLYSFGRIGGDFIVGMNKFTARKWITFALRRAGIDIVNLRVVLFGKGTILIVDAKAICPTTCFTFAMSWRTNNVGHEGSNRNYLHISLGEILGRLFNFSKWRFGILFYRSLGSNITRNEYFVRRCTNKIMFFYLKASF